MKKTTNAKKTKVSMPVKKSIPNVEAASTLLKVDTYMDTAPNFTSTPEFIQFAAFYDGSFPKNKNSYYYKYNTIFGQQRPLNENDIIVSPFFFPLVGNSSMFSKNIFAELTRLFFFSLQYGIPTEKIENFLSYQYESFDDQEGFIKFITYYLSSLPEKYKPGKENREIINKWILKNKKAIKKVGAPKIAVIGLDELMEVEKFNLVMEYLIVDGLIQKNGNDYTFTPKARKKKFRKLLGCLGYYLFEKELIKPEYKYSPTLFAQAFEKTFKVGIKSMESFIRAFEEKDVRINVFYYQDKFPTLTTKFDRTRRQ
jgi:hypothetical protein